MNPLRGEVIAIGDELTTGQRLDTNTQWLSERLTEAGIEVVFHTTVADSMEANLEVFNTASRRADVVVSTGGLGPTADDLTRDAMALAAGVELIEDPESLAAIKAIFVSRGREMPSQNRRQAQFPAGATIITNNGGTAPGVDLTFNGCRFFALPGVPAEMRPMWTESVEPAIAKMSPLRRVIHHWLVRCFGVGESHLESMLPDLIARGREPLVGITASKATLTLRITASGADTADCLLKMQPTLEQVRSTLGSLIFAEQPGGQDEIELPHHVIDLLKDRELTIATEEIMTRGLLGEWLAAAGQESGFVRTCRYSSQDFSGEPAAVAKEIAAEGCGIAIGSLRPEGVVPIAVATPSGIAEKEITLVGHPSIHRPLVAKHALNLLRLELIS